MPGLECSALDGLPPAVRSLPQLRMLYFVSGSEAPMQPLPARGPWLQHLELLATHADVLIPSSAVLAAAPRLQHVVFTSVPDPETPAFSACWSGPAWRAFWSWAAVHPSLSALSFAFESGQPAEVWEPLFDAAVELRGQRPSLTIDRDSCSMYEKFDA